MKTIPFTVAVLALCVLATPSAFAQAKKKPGQPQQPPAYSPPPPGPAELRPKVEALLGGYEFEPTKAHWDKLGPSALDVLVAIANDNSALPSRRARAIASMNHFDGAAVSGNLITFTQSSSLPPTLRATAASVLVAREGDSALPTVTPLLSSSDVRVREMVAKSLARLGTADARKSLESRRDTEQDPAVREVIQRGLAPSR